jgi:hypothetical protein
MLANQFANQFDRRDASFGSKLCTMSKTRQTDHPLARSLQAARLSQLRRLIPIDPGGG